MPPGEPVPAEHLGLFQAERERIFGLLIEVPQIPAVLKVAAGAP